MIGSYDRQIEFGGVKCLKGLDASLKLTEGKLKAIILVSGFIIIMLVDICWGFKAYQFPAFCKSCHEMYPEYYTWENSSHSKIACVSCHIKPGIENFLVHKIRSLSQVYYHFTKSYMTPIAIKEKVDNSQCERCHDMSKRVTTPSGDLKFDHNKHVNQKIDCVVCHKGVAHGQIEEKGFTAMTDYNSWNSQMGKAYVNSPVSKHYTNLQMKQCIDCHTEKKVPLPVIHVIARLWKQTAIRRQTGYLLCMGNRPLKILIPVISAIRLHQNIKV